MTLNDFINKHCQKVYAPDAMDAYDTEVSALEYELHQFRCGDCFGRGKSYSGERCVACNGTGTLSAALRLAMIAEDAVAAVCSFFERLAKA